MTKIDATARVESGAAIGKDVIIGPYCVVGANVTLGDGCHLVSHVSVLGHTTIGARTAVYPFASLGAPPQSLGYKGEPTRLEVGEDCIIREGVTMNCGTAAGGGVTRIGDRGFFMAYSHIAHDCTVGNDVIFANSATLAGHCQVGDFVFIGGLSAAHQHTRIGAQAMVGGLTAIRGDVIPFGVVNSVSGTLDGLNIVGMRRRKFTRERLHAVRTFFRKLFHGPGAFADRLADVESETAQDPAIAEIVAFVRAADKRSITMPGSAAPPAGD
jgi:UDP-N-acetylglucosamine acyltransferase